MKKLFIIYLLFIGLQTFSQETKELTNDEIVTRIINLEDYDFKKVDSIFKKKKNDKEAIKLLIKRSNDKDFVKAQIYANNLLGRYYRNKTEYKKAIESHKEAALVAKKNNDVQSEIISLNMIGVVYRRADNIPRALEYHQQAYELANETNPKSTAIKKSLSVSENSLGNIYLDLKQYELALEQFEKSILIQQDLTDKRGLAINHQNIGYAYEMLAKYDTALKNYKKSLDYNNKIDSDFGRVICNGSIASVYMKQNKPLKAFETIRPVLALAKKNKDDRYLAETYNILGWTQIGVNKFTEAEENLKKALKFGQDYNISSVIYNATKYLSLLYAKKKDFKKAYEYNKWSAEEESKTFNEKNILYVTKLTTDYKGRVKNEQIKELENANIRNRNLLIISLGSLALLGILAFSLFRYRSIKNDKRILTLEQEALRSQMNPHFVFNALNSIKLYIVNNDRKNAVRYLNKFAKLIRRILEASKVKEVSLLEELETMDLYMSIENIRFSNEINYEVKIPSELNSEVIKVPPLVLQPFLENAIWHGLSSKGEEKNISIDIKKISNEHLQIDITDNGIGRDAAQKIKNNKSLKRESVGIDLTKARLNNFSRFYDNNFNIKYIDLKDNDTPLGTQVSIKIPLK